MDIFDCAGDHNNQNLLKIYWNNVKCVILVYSIDSKVSYDKLYDWIDAAN